MLPECDNCGALMRLQIDSSRPFRYRCATCHAKRVDGDASDR